MPVRPLRLAFAAALVLSALAPPSAQAAVSCFSQDADIKGTPGSDVIVGTSGADVIAGLGGDDHLIGKGGNDKICGADGDDVLSGGGGKDRITGGEGDDSVTGGDGGDTLLGNPGDDMLGGNAGQDDVSGHAGSDMLHGGTGPDDLDGGTDPEARAPDADTSIDYLNGGKYPPPYPTGNHCHNADTFPANCDWVDLEVGTSFDHYDPATDTVFFSVTLKNTSSNHAVPTAHEIRLSGNGEYVSGGPAGSCSSNAEENFFTCTGFRLSSNESIVQLLMSQPRNQFGNTANAFVSSIDWEIYTDNNFAIAGYDHP